MLEVEVVEVQLHLLLDILVEHLPHMKLHLIVQLLLIRQKLLIIIIQMRHHKQLTDFIMDLVKKVQTQFLMHLQHWF